MSLEQRVLEAIRATLPENTAKELRDYLTKAEEAFQTAQKVHELKIENDKLRVEIETVRRKCDAFDEREAAIVKGKAEVEQGKRELEVWKLQHQVEIQKTTLNTYTDLVKTVFRNPRMIRQEFGNMPVPCDPGQYPQSGNYSKTVTTEDDL